jgi:signal transduction histidine kinase
LAVDTPRQRSGLDAEAVHTLSNQLAVILGFIELVLTETPPDDPRHADLVEIREAAHECARIVSRSHEQG